MGKEQEASFGVGQTGVTFSCTGTTTIFHKYISKEML